MASRVSCQFSLSVVQKEFVGNKHTEKDTGSMQEKCLYWYLFVPWRTFCLLLWRDAHHFVIIWCFSLITSALKTAQWVFLWKKSTKKSCGKIFAKNSFLLTATHNVASFPLQITAFAVSISEKKPLKQLTWVSLPVSVCKWILKTNQNHVQNLMIQKIMCAKPRDSSKTHSNCPILFSVNSASVLSRSFSKTLEMPKRSSGPQSCIIS